MPLQNKPYNMLGQSEVKWIELRSGGGLHDLQETI